MVNKVRVGDKLTLPSGEVVHVSMAADPARPWRPHKVGTSWGLRREQPPGQVHREIWLYYTGDQPLPLRLDERDAAALAFELNRVGPT
jgi:hypothetical protein